MLYFKILNYNNNLLYIQQQSPCAGQATVAGILETAVQWVHLFLHDECCFFTMEIHVSVMKRHRVETISKNTKKPL